MSEVTTKPAGFVLPAAAPEPAAASTQVAVYRAAPQEIAAAMRNAGDVIDKTLVPLAHKRKDVSVITDNWGFSLLGLPLAGAVWMFTDAAVVPMVIAGASAALSTIGGFLHPILRRRAVAAAPPLLQGDARDEVLKLGEARTAFASTERGGRVEAPELDLFVAHKAKKTLDEIKRGYDRTDDPELIALLEKYAAATASLTPEDQQVFDFISKCLESQNHYYSAREVPKLFEELPADKQYALSHFVRDTFFNDDGPTVGRHCDGPGFTRIFHAIEALHPRLTVPFETKPEHTPAKVGDSGNLIQTLTNLADIQEKLDVQPHLHNESFAPSAIQEAVALAISNDRSGVERVLIGTLAQRQLQTLDSHGTFAYRTRAALADLQAMADAEPISVRERADKIMTKIDHISRTIPTARGRSREDNTPALDLRQIISFLEVIELMNLK